ncbi:MAG TPA: ATP-binding protein, partial [Hydrogenophaga sp.]|nr:ATP-binding protein [Hydrogenophaga sp.]
LLSTYDAAIQRNRELSRIQEALEKSSSELLATNQFLDSVIENIPDMVFVKDAADLRFVRLNRAGEQLLGYSRAEFLGKNDHDLFPRDQADLFTAKDREALEAGTVEDIPEEPIKTREKGVRRLHTKKIPIADEYGRARYLLGISEDVTEQKEKEREILRLNAALEQRATELDDANRELESFSYSVSHDLRAPLRRINGYVQMLAGDIGDHLGDEPQRYLKVIGEASRQMGLLIDDLLEFSRVKLIEMREARVDLNDLTREVLASLETEINGRNIAWNISPLSKVSGDAAMLKQALVNLLGNAVKYTRYRDPARIEIGTAGEENGRIVVFVRDNGAGFNMQYADKLFGVFQRLHRADEFEGTGIGLANVQRIIARHGGRIWAEAEPDRGATFYFTLKPAEAGE